MIIPEVAENEDLRLTKLVETGLLDSASSADYDRFTAIARHLFDVPIALISLVDAERQWFKAKSGLSVSETARDISFCGHAVLSEQLFIVPDTLKDERFLDNPLVTDAPFIRFYAGMPLVMAPGLAIGTLCIIDTQPRYLTANEKQLLQDLAALVVQQIKQYELIVRKQELKLAKQLSDVIAKAQSEFINAENQGHAFANLLTDLLSLTASEYGFIGEVHYENDQPYLKTHAITNIAWDDATRAFFAANAPNGLEFRNLNTLFGAALTEKKPVIANTPGTDPRAGGLPAGHPALNSFMALPIWYHNQMIGLLGVANREQGYSQQLIDFLNPLQLTIGQLIAVYRLQRQQTQTQKELQRLSQVASHTTNAVIITNRRGEIEWVNSSFSRITGYTLTEVMGKSPGSFLQGPATDPQTVLKMREALRAGQGFDLVILNYTKTAQPYWLHISCSPIINASGEVEGFIAIESDITEQIGLEQKITNQKTFFENIFKSNIAAITVLDEQGRIIIANPGAEKILGIEAKKLQDGSLSYNDPVWQITDLQGHPLAESRLPFAQLKSGVPVITDFQHNILWPNGDCRTLSISGAVLTDIERQDKKYVFYIQDITDKLRVEKMKNEFVATVSHELRTPLTSIIASVDMLQSVVSCLPEPMQPLVTIAQRNGKRLNFLINDLLDMEKLIAGRMRFELKTFNLARLLQYNIDSHHAYAAQHGVELRLMPVDPQLHISIDEQRFAQVLANLLSNAIKFSPANSQVTITAEVQGELVRIWVRDRGPGIPPAFRDRIFQKFAQADSTDSRKIGGTGLGLAVSKQLVEKMAGQIGFDSMTKEGAHFWIAFPIVTHSEVHSAC